jgi:hypothetical protein
MHVCVHVFSACTCMWVCVYLCVCVCCMHVCVHVRACVYVPVLMTYTLAMRAVCVSFVVRRGVGMATDVGYASAGSIAGHERREGTRETLAMHLKAARGGGPLAGKCGAIPLQAPDQSLGPLASHWVFTWQPLKIH